MIDLPNDAKTLKTIIKQLLRHGNQLRRKYIMQLQTTRLSSKGQVIIPQTILDAYHLNCGQELEIEATSQGILLKAKNSPTKTTINDLIGCTGYQGKAKTLEEMDAGIRQGIIAEWGKHDSD